MALDGGAAGSTRGRHRDRASHRPLAIGARASGRAGAGHASTLDRSGRRRFGAQRSLSRAAGRHRIAGSSGERTDTRRPSHPIGCTVCRRRTRPREPQRGDARGARRCRATAAPVDLQTDRRPARPVQPANLHPDQRRADPMDALQRQRDERLDHRPRAVRRMALQPRRLRQRRPRRAGLVGGERAGRLRRRAGAACSTRTRHSAAGWIRSATTCTTSRFSSG